jgi:hypothetical protein
VRPGLRRAIHSLVPLALTVMIVAPVLPAPADRLGAAIAGKTRVISVLQTWNMYAPDPQRSHTYFSVKAMLADGTTVALDEAEQAERGWGHIWEWQKRRTDIWRFYAGMKPEEQNVNRTWYLRGLCVREERARGVAPVRLVSERVRRRFTPPDEVDAGAPGLGEPSRAHVQSINCADWPERAMIANDRIRRGLEAADPRPKLGPRPPRTPRARPDAAG